MNGPDQPRRLRDGWRDHPHPSRLDENDPAGVPALEAHRRAVDRGDAGYLDPNTALFVMTAPYLRDRGWCCDRGCRHCPYIGAHGADEPTQRPEND